MGAALFVDVLSIAEKYSRVNTFISFDILCNIEYTIVSAEGIVLWRMGMAKIKRTHTFDPELLERLERAAKQERRAVSEQLSIFLEQALNRFEKEQSTKSESKSGNWSPALLAA